MQESGTPPSIVVGIDGSRAAIRAALWAVDEAVSRDITLRLLYAVDPEDAPGELAAADIAVRYAVTAVESTDKPVKIEVEITQGNPVSSLLRASRSAAMVCVGAVGYRHFQPGRVGSTAAAVAHNAHCPVAIIRGPDSPWRSHDRYVVVEVDASPNNGVLLETAILEACLRHAPLRAVTCCTSPGDHDQPASADRDRRMLADLDRRLTRWRRRYPDLRAESVVVNGGILDYVDKHPQSVQLLIAGARAGHHLEVTRPAGNAVLHQTDCSVLIVDRPHL